MTQDLNYGREATTPTNIPAVISIISGLLLCIPLTGLLALPCGFFGYRKSKSLGGSGSVISRVGMVLGVINLLWWSALLLGAFGQYRTFTLSKPAIEAQRTFIRAVSTGNISDAKSLCTNAIDEDRLTATFEQIQKLGMIESVDATWGGKYHSASDIEVTAEVKFEHFSKMITGHWQTTEKGPLLTAYELRDPPTTEPSTQPTK